MSSGIRDITMTGEVSQPAVREQRLWPESMRPMQDGLDLQTLLLIGKRYKYGILFITLLCTGISIFYAYSRIPVYRADALVQIEEKSAGFPGLEEMSELLTQKVQSSTALQVIKSRRVLGVAVDQLNLRTHAQPVYFPLLGRELAYYFEKAGIEIDLPKDAYFGLGNYCWGGESIQVSHFSVETGEYIKAWRIHKTSINAYEVIDDNGRLVLTGKVGESARHLDSDYGWVEVFVAEMTGPVGASFELSRSARLAEINRIKEGLSVSERGKKTGVIELSYKDSSPILAQAIVDRVAQTYLRLNVEQRSQEAAQMLIFLDKQLPGMKDKLEQAEAVLNKHRQRVGTVNVGMEAQAALDGSARIEAQLSTLVLTQQELSRRFTPSHPRVIALEEKIRYLKGKLGHFNGKLKKLPKTEWESLKLSRDVKVASELYLTLLNKRQELMLAKAGTVGNVQIIDQAEVNLRPLGVGPAQVVARGVMLGLVLGGGLAFLLNSLRKELFDPKDVELKTGYSVFATVVKSADQVSLKMGHKSSGKMKGIQPLARFKPNDPAVEALRSLRTSLQFAQLEAKNNVIAISGPAPDIGKSFIAVNLATVLADSGKKVLLVDTDLRRGYLHHYFGQPRTPGLSDVITGQTRLSKSIIVMEKNLHFMSTGTLPPNPSEILSSSKFAKVLSRASEYYDLVIVDTSPVLAVSDPIEVARHAGTLLLTLKSGQHSEREVNDAIKKFTQVGITVNGLVLNNVKNASSTGYKYGQYGYYSYN